MNKPINFVYFDLGGVFFDYQGTTAFVEKFNIDYQDFKESRKEYLTDCLLGKITSDEYINSTLKKLGIDFRFDNYNDYWASKSKPYPQIHDLVFKLSKRYPIGIITNDFRDAFSGYLKHGLIPDIDYQVILQSSKLGLKKPDKKIFKIAEKMCNYSGKDILFIDDVEKNILAAKKLGWQTYLFDNDEMDYSVENILNKLHFDKK